MSLKYTYLLATVLSICLFFLSCSQDKDDLLKDPISSTDPADSTDPKISYKPMLSYSMDDAAKGDEFLNWSKSLIDDTRAVSEGKSIKITTDPGEELLPGCSGRHRFAGRTVLPENMQVPQGKTIWIRVMHYIPSSFSLGYKYGGEQDRDAATACGQNKDGNSRVKWLVISPTNGTGRVYFLPQAYRRALGDGSGTMRIATEFEHGLTNIEANLPRDKWFSLQMAVKISSESDGFIRAWIDDTFIGEMNGPTMSPGSSVKDWGIGDYWNGVPWTDGEAGRTDFWIDDIIIASDMDGFGAPTTLDADGRSFISADTRVSDF